MMKQLQEAMELGRELLAAMRELIEELRLQRHANNR